MRLRGSAPAPQDLCRDLRWPNDGLPALLLPGGEGLTEYGDALELMELLSQRAPDQPDTILALQHPVVATLGRRGGMEDLHRRHRRDADGQLRLIEVHEVARGGKITMHAPGQLVVYPVVHLPSLAGDVGRGPLGDLPRYARLLEDAILMTCECFGVVAVRRPGLAGVWLDERRKLASLGVGVTRGWSQHGIALNVCPDLSVFEAMTPCGIGGAELTSLEAALAAEGRPSPTLLEVRDRLLGILRPMLVRRR